MNTQKWNRFKKQPFISDSAALLFKSEVWMHPSGSEGEDEHGRESETWLTCSDAAEHNLFIPDPTSMSVRPFKRKAGKLLITQQISWQPVTANLWKMGSRLL